MSGRAVGAKCLSRASGLFSKSEKSETRYVAFRSFEINLSQR